jgi:hypothetical protein
MAAKLRIKCPHCQQIVNLPGENVPCPHCGKPVSVCTDTCVYLYRQGSPLGVAAGFGIYINGEPYGHIGNTETLCFPLPQGSYTFHCAAGMNRKCRDLVVNLNADTPKHYAKVYMKPGFWTNSFVIQPMDPKLLNL